MKNKLLTFASFVMLFVVVGFLIRPTHTPITDAEVETLSQALNGALRQPQATAPMAAPPVANSQRESIMAIVYYQDAVTWFIKARGQTALIDENAQTFSRLFLDQLKFDDNQQPDFSHIPQSYQRPSVEAMRVASFNINGLQVSVSKLAGQQDIEANIARWRGQLQMAANDPQFVKFENNNKTVLVRLNQVAGETATNNQVAAPKPPAKENLDDFIEFTLNDKWKRLEQAQGMASGALALSLEGQEHQVAVLRLPVAVPLETILGIWQEKMGIDSKQTLTPTPLMSKANQQWQLYSLQGESNSIYVAMFKGATRYTFLRLASQGDVSEMAKDEFHWLLETSRVILP